MSNSATSSGLDQLADPLRAIRQQFEAVLEPHRPALWEFCRQLTGSAWDAEDLVQETLLKAFASLPQLWQPVNPRAYLFRIASNRWIDQLRRDRCVPLDDIDAHPDIPSGSSPESSLEISEAMGRLVRLLPPRQRVILLLCEAFDFRAREVAAMIGTTEGAVKSVLHRARVTLTEPGPNESGVAPRLSNENELEPIVQRYLDAFNARDADAIAALLHDDAVTTIIGSAEELGREATRRASLAEWAVDPNEQWAMAGRLDGRPVLFVLYRTSAHERALAWLIELETGGGGIHRQRQYYFCPELIRYAAESLGVPAVTHGYQYVLPGV